MSLNIILAALLLLPCTSYSAHNTAPATTLAHPIATKPWWTKTKKNIAFGFTALAGIAATLIIYTVKKNQREALESLLLTAAQYNKVTDVEELLNKGINPNFVDSRNESPLFHAAYNGNERIVLFLLQHGADPNLNAFEERFTPLVQAISGNYPAVVKLLIDADANPNGDRNTFRPGNTPLVYAIDHNQKEIVEILLSSNKICVDEKRSITDHTPLYWAKHPLDPNKLPNPDIIRLLESVGAKEE
jgi:ankyrin repeat protein